MLAQLQLLQQRTLRLLLVELEQLLLHLLVLLLTHVVLLELLQQLQLGTTLGHVTILLLHLWYRTHG